MAFSSRRAIQSSPAIAGDVVYFTARDNNIYGLDARTGKQVWQYKTGNEIGIQNYWDFYLSSPNISNGVLYIGSGDGNLYAFDVNSKKLKWKYFVGARIKATPAIAKDRIVFGAMDGNVYAVDLKGNLLWKFSTDGAAFTFEQFNNDRTSVFCSAAVNDSIVAVGGRDGFLYVIDLITGKEKWRTDHKGSWVLSTAIDKGVVYAASGSAFFVQALEESTGKELWRFKTRSAIFSSISIAGDILHFADRAGYVYGVDKSGKEKWCFPAGSMSFATPVPYNNNIYCATDEGVLYSLNSGNKSDTSTAKPQRYVFWEPKKTDTAFNWFQNSGDVFIRDYFRSNGYQVVNAGQLEDVLKQEINNKRRTVVVFANNRIPLNVIGDDPANSLLKQYLLAGGKAVLLGDNPLIYHINPTTGVLDSQRYALAEKVFDIKFPLRKNVLGFYSSIITQEGKKQGLERNWVGFGPVEPTEVTTVLAKDEFGKATAWLKNYGGAEGTGLLQLWIPRTVAEADLHTIQRVIEYGIGW